MIRCMLFLDPGGMTKIDEWEVLGHIDIENDFIRSAHTEGKRGNYMARIYKKRKKMWMRLRVTDFPRLSYHPWNLVREILNEAAKQNGGRL